jgi:hypothetical protein
LAGAAATAARCLTLLGLVVCSLAGIQRGQFGVHLVSAGLAEVHLIVQLRVDVLDVAVQRWQSDDGSESSDSAEHDSRERDTSHLTDHVGLGFFLFGVVHGLS